MLTLKGQRCLPAPGMGLSSECLEPPDESLDQVLLCRTYVLCMVRITAPDFGVFWECGAENSQAASCPRDCAYKEGVFLTPGRETLP